jgi:uncharacterized FlaG/YvyC family protein
MASDGNPVKIPAASLVHGSQAQIPFSIKEQSGKSLPPGGKVATSAADKAVTHAAAQAASAQEASAKVSTAASLEALIAQLNKHLNDSGRPDQFRVDPSSGNKVIQQINPATGDVIGEFLISEFPALARSVGVTGSVLIDSRA